MQVAPIKPTLKAPGTHRLKPKYDAPLSKFAFKFNLRRFILLLWTCQLIMFCFCLTTLFTSSKIASMVGWCRLTLPNFVESAWK